MDNRYYVYILFDPRDNTPFYVGKGTGKRYANHEVEYIKQIEYLEKISSIPLEMLSLKHSVIHELNQKTLKPSIKLIENLTNDNALLLEHALIAWFGRRVCGNGVLTNLLCGGSCAELYFDDEQLIRILEHEHLQKEILNYKKVSTKWVARTLQFYEKNEYAYPFKDLTIDWLYQYHGCYQQFAVRVIEKLREYDAVITPFYWVRKSTRNDLKLDSTYIMEESLDIIQKIKWGNLVSDFENYKSEYGRLNNK